MDAKKKKEIKAMLIKMKEHKLSEIKQNNDDLESVENFKDDAQDFADMATNIYDKELHYDLTEKNKKLLVDIEDALERIDKGNYGKCDSCGGEVSFERLKALPFAKTCMKCLSGKKGKGRK
ncbi:MAG TPA: TraR/DksA C4-type zinc finger protein [Candidatus Goldiibacteriota bacterium]|nr:TraR/DksA C4-type zinc finger protein [Candidatus Goldiibacteriota bacterium]HPN64521.1 TraR/DksA C4-type zinc finger protein [Candidatus Goldiibacteriota bacterium]HRQ43394.1 TraR/DksA C4-type zinc finger protein [Candidatus Goldiibacteriota bacterium]